MEGLTTLWKTAATAGFPAGTARRAASAAEAGVGILVYPYASRFSRSSRPGPERPERQFYARAQQEGLVRDGELLRGVKGLTLLS